MVTVPVDRTDRPYPEAVHDRGLPRVQSGTAGPSAVLFALLIASGCSSTEAPTTEPEQAPAPTTTMVEVRPTLEEQEAPDWIGEVVNLHDLADEACFNVYSWVQGDRLVEIDTVVPCEGPHQHEIYRIAQHPARRGAPWPGDREMEAFATAECYDAFADFVGTIYELSELEIGFLTPRRVDFEHESAQFRGIHCYVFREDGEEMVGSARGSLS